MDTIGRLEVKVDSIRKRLLNPKLENPCVLVFKGISSNSYLPVYISNVQARLIQKIMKIMLHVDPIPLESLLTTLDLPIEQMSKGTLEPIIIEPKGENNFIACLILKNSDRKDKVRAEIPVGNDSLISFSTSTYLCR